MPVACVPVQHIVVVRCVEQLLCASLFGFSIFDVRRLSEVSSCVSSSSLGNKVGRIGRFCFLLGGNVFDTKELLRACTFENAALLVTLVISACLPARNSSIHVARTPLGILHLNNLVVGRCVPQLLSSSPALLRTGLYSRLVLLLHPAQWEKLHIVGGVMKILDHLRVRADLFDRFRLAEELVVPG